MTDNFDRAPGAGRNRFKPNSPGFGEHDGGRHPETSEADGKTPFFSLREPLRQPRTSPPLAESSSLSVTGGDGRVTKAAYTSQSFHCHATPKPQTPSSVPFSSTLSAYAPEFYPKNYTPTRSVTVTLQNYTPHQEPTDDDGTDGYYAEASFAELVQDFLNHLNSSPASFELEIESITASLNSWITSEEMLQELVELIYTQSTSVPNFAYTGARLCNHLSHHLTITPPAGNFRKLLLQRCQKEYEQRDLAVRGDDVTRKHFHSYVLFLGELYLNLELKSRRGPPSRADILLSALKDLAASLLSHPEDNNLICAVKLLKLTGSVLEDSWKESGKPHMDELIQRTENIVLDASCSRDVKHMLLRLVELRSSDWGRVRATAAPSEPTPDNDPNYFMNEPTFYTADGTPFTAADPDYSEKYQEILDRENYFPDFEENGNEEDFDLEEMDPEIEEAFEKFCLESERRRI
ncbi:hypothetical protein GJAV_G00049950 [Gymnothorax javanicus]|nr:hypothetical protein GJAV_G00049950 [Gymnothorax javanicus]